MHFNICTVNKLLRRLHLWWYPHGDLVEFELEIEIFIINNVMLLLCYYQNAISIHKHTATASEARLNSYRNIILL